MPLLLVEHDLRDDAVVVRAKGDVDSSSVVQLSEHLKTAMQLVVTHPARLVVVDLGSVTYFGSAGLNALLDGRDQASEAGASVCLVAHNAEVLRPIEITNLDKIFDVYPTVAAAVECRHDQHQRGPTS
jgi:anti-sigma B factor antagonist